jgi:putative Holliday junction resolvase
MYTHLSVDWGEKICGIAFGNSDIGIIIPSDSSHPSDTVQYFLESYLIKYPLIKTFVVGYPSNFKGKATRISDHVDKFVDQLKTKFDGLEIITFDERNTTKQAINLLPTRHLKYQRDNLSAYTLLQHYFDQLNSAKHNKM